MNPQYVDPQVIQNFLYLVGGLAALFFSTFTVLLWRGRGKLDNEEDEKLD